MFNTSTIKGEFRYIEKPLLTKSASVIEFQKNKGIYNAETGEAKF